MGSEAVSIPDLQSASGQGSNKVSNRWAAKLALGENLFVSLALGAMVILPLAEALLRRTLHVSIPASIAIVQHMVLVVGMLGGAIAARERRLLYLANVGETKLRGWPKSASRIFTSGIAVVVTGFLCFASIQFVLSEL